MSPVSKTLIVGAVDGRVDDLVPVDRALDSTVLQVVDILLTMYKTVSNGLDKELK